MLGKKHSAILIMVLKFLILQNFCLEIQRTNHFLFANVLFTYAMDYDISQLSKGKLLGDESKFQLFRVVILSICLNQCECASL